MLAIPSFRAEMAELRASSVGVALDQLSDLVPDPAWARWAAHLAAFTTIEAVIAWLDAGQPDREHAARRISQVVAAIVRSARR